MFIFLPFPDGRQASPEERRLNAIRLQTGYL